MAEKLSSVVAVLATWFFQSKGRFWGETCRGRGVRVMWVQPALPRVCEKQKEHTLPSPSFQGGCAVGLGRLLWAVCPAEE